MIKNKVVYKEVVLSADWMGNRSGAVVNLNEKMADTLIKRGTAKPADREEKKDIQRPQKDKMMRPAKRK